jgi:putative phosphoribosyl transferase
VFISERIERLRKENLMAEERFKNRSEAGELLAERLDAYAGRDDVIVLALPRGGVPVGYAVTNALQVQLDILLVRKLGVPGHEEYAMGAIASGGLRIVQPTVVENLNIPSAAIEAVIQRESLEIERRENLYREGRPALPLRERIAILVDDGLATGSTMLAAAQAVRNGNPARIVIAVPVASQQACQMLASQADEVVCLRTPEPFYAVGMWYENFAQTSDAEVKSLLEKAELQQTKNMPAMHDAKHGDRHLTPRQMQQTDRRINR